MRTNKLLVVSKVFKTQALIKTLASLFLVGAAFVSGMLAAIATPSFSSYTEIRYLIFLLTISSILFLVAIFYCWRMPAISKFTWVMLLYAPVLYLFVEYIYPKYGTSNQVEYNQNH